MKKVIKTVMVGLGNVNRNFLKILEMKAERLRDQYGVQFQVVAVADSSGVAVNHGGFDPVELRQFKEAGGRVSQLATYLPDQRVETLLADLACDLVLEASPVNLQDGAPGQPITRAALQRGISVVLANKGPLVLAFDELQQLATDHRAGLAYSATVCGALPVINIGQRDLIAADVSLVRGIFNSTSNFILDQIARGESYDGALAEAQHRGIAEADPSLDVEGWDTANKLVIIANSFLGLSVKLADVAVTGITQLKPELFQEASAQGQAIKLVATADLTVTVPKLTVQPTCLPLTDFLGGCGSWEMGIEIQSDLYGKLYHKIWEREPLPTAAAMLRDAVTLFSGQWAVGSG